MLILTLIISLTTVFSLLVKGYFPMHDDLQIIRMFEIEKCFMDGQIPCRWSPDMAFGYGQAMFSFYSAFPYYLGILIRLLTPFSIIDTVKILFAITLVASGVGMYFLSKEFFGKLGGFLSGVFYVLAPYRAVNVYVRGAMSESFSLAILPFLWLFVYRTIKNPSFKNTLILALLTAFQLSTHNISTMIYAPFTVVWVIFWLVKEKNIKSILDLVAGGALGFGLAAFFIIPVFLEKNLIQEEIFTTNYSFYASHFVSVFQLFVSRFWDYGGSVFGTDDHMSFQVGIAHWMTALLVALYAFYYFVKTKKSEWLLVLTLFVMGLFSLFLAHQKSYLIWEAIPTLSFVQFPWRFLGLGVFFLSFCLGGLSLVKLKLKYPLSFVLVLIVFALNISYFRPDAHFYDETDQTKLSGELFIIQQKSAYLDYLPKSVPNPPSELAPDTPEITSGEGEVLNFTKTSSTFFFDANIYDDAEIDIPIIYFPDWEVYTLKDQGIRVNAYPSGDHGTIHISLPKGNHMVYGRFVDTPIRTASNAISLLSLFILFGSAIVYSMRAKR